MKGLHRKNSSDLDMGRRPEIKSDEFLVCNPFMIEIYMRCEDLFTAEKVLHLFGASLSAPDAPQNARAVGV